MTKTRIGPQLPETEYCIICDATDSIMRVADTVVLEGARTEIPNTVATLIIDDHVFSVCENCDCDFVTPEQAKLNDGRKRYENPRHKKSCIG